MELTIEIDSANVREREIDSGKGSFIARDQIGWLNIPGKRYPQEIVVSLEAGQAAYAEGIYRISEDSITIDRYKRVAFQRALRLIPIDRE